MRKRKLWASILQISALFIGASPFLSAQENSSVAGRIGSYLSELAESGGFSGAVLASTGGEVLVAQGYGLANVELNVPNDAQTKFRIGSMTKQFTSMAILILEERGQLRLQDPLADHLPRVPRAWKEITLHQLLTHTSGLMHPWDSPEFAESAMVPQSLDEVLARFYDEPLLSSPGERFHYSGLGYFILAKVIETVSGVKYHEFLREEIFDPLGMKNTGGDRADTVLAKRASGYTIENDVLLNAPPIHMPVLTGGGDLYSTVLDLGLWNDALNAGSLVSPESYERLYKPELDGYAYGWRVGDLNGRLVIAHAGSVNGFRGQIVRIPADEVCVVVLSNYDTADLPQIIGQLMNFVLE
jgi:CubicO group peptidase (beta-lactamase class C family)